MARKNTQLVPMNLSTMGSQDQKFQRNCSWCGTYGHVARDCRKKTEHMQNNQTSRWLARTTKQKANLARVNPTKARAKERTKAKDRVNNTARKERKDVMRWSGTKTNKKHKPVKSPQSALTRVRITLTNGVTQIGGRVTGAQICGQIFRGSKRHDNCHRHSQPKNSPIRHRAEAFRC